MYAVFKTGGKQYRAQQGERLRIEKIEASEGDAVEFDQVLLVGEGSSVTVGKPLVAGGKVQATVLAQAKADKVSIIKFRRRQNYLRMKGHRQRYTEIEVTGIVGA